MLGNLLGGRKNGLPLGGRSGPVATRSVFAVGDLHGRFDLLEGLLETMMIDILRTGDAEGQAPELAFLGDAVDRGPHSREVIEFLIAIVEWSEVKPIFLVGNHELMLLQFLNNPVGARRWLRYGGFETLRSYGLDRVRDLGDEDELREIAHWFRGALGLHLAFLEDLRALHVNGNLLFAHAGADPRRPAAEQEIDALVWGVPEFHRMRRSDDLWVVHGHNVVKEPTARSGRIAVDTGAYQTGRLSAVKISGDQTSFLTHEGAPDPGALLDDSY